MTNQRLNQFSRYRACVICNIRAKHGKFHRASGLCIDCLQLIPWILQPRCLRCGRATSCPDCRYRKRSRLLMNRSAVQYTAAMKDWLSRYKYHGDERLAFLLSWMLEFAYEQLCMALAQHQVKIHALTYVPLSEVRSRERTFNQAERLARLLGQRLQLPVLSLLHRKRHTKRQSHKKRSDRLHDLEQAFTTLSSVQSLSKGLNIAIIDDVYTTGSTLHHCAKELKRHASVNIFSLTWAR